MGLLQKLVVAVLSITLFNSCNNDLDLLDDYKETPIIYGLLNIADSVQYIRVQKAYLGEGNALLMAQNSDSIYYNKADISVKLDESINGVATRSILLVADTAQPKNDGLFVNYPHLVYSTNSLLKKDAQYKLIFNNNKTGKTVTAFTKLVDKVQLPPLLGIPEINIVVDNPNPIKVNPVANGKVYALDVIFNYAEKDVSNPLPIYEHKSVKFPVGDMVNNSSVNSVEFIINGTQFYSYIGGRIPIDTAVCRPVSEVTIDFVFTVGAEDFYIYYSVNNQSNNLSQTIPDFTNLSEGKGIFSSRVNTKFANYKLKSQSTSILLNSIYTQGRFSATNCQ